MENIKQLLRQAFYKDKYKAMVMVVFGEDFGLPIRLLDVTIPAGGQDVPKLIEAIKLVKAYNEFYGDRVAKVLKRLHDEGLIMELRFGREGSPVIYVEPPHWTSQASNFKGGERRKYSAQERYRMFLRIRDALSVERPDELGFVKFPTGLGNPYYEDISLEDVKEGKIWYVRAWWD